MCLGIPGKVVEIYRENNISMGKIDFGGVTREACLEYVPEAKIGDFALVHVGFVLNLISEQEAAETMKILKEIADIDSELKPEQSKS